MRSCDTVDLENALEELRDAAEGFDRDGEESRHEDRRLEFETLDEVLRQAAFRYAAEELEVAGIADERAIAHLRRLADAPSLKLQLERLQTE